tara:strand:+ start:706 stop:1200 length:495 start_codon:yes stop_codon:yes gene_type:complete
MIFIGIDPGLDGGLAAIYPNGNIYVTVMPTERVGKKRQLDGCEIREWIHNNDVFECRSEPQKITIEKVHAMPGQGVTSMFNFGVGFGILRGICSGLGLSYDLVTPQAWQKVMLEGRGKGAKYEVAHELWPDVDFRATERCRKPHTGMVDAALIAEASRRMRGGK